MTERLYYTDAYLRAFTATVVARADDGLRAYLDRSAFYPTSGGQPFDRGSLGGVEVVDVVDEGERVAHVLAAPLPPGDTVTGTVDWDRRLDHMRQHTGQHLLSAVFAERFGLETVSVHFGPDYATLDLGAEVVPPGKLVEAERVANALVMEDRPVTVSFEDAATATGLRKASDRTGTLRIVTIEGLDRSACGGTHVRTTGEIGPILLRRQEKVKKQARVEFLCGDRAVRRARADYQVLAGLAAANSASIDELGALLAAQGEQLRASEAARRKLEEERAADRARAAVAAAAPGADGVRWIVERRPAGTTDDVRAFALAVAGQARAAYAVRLEATRTVLLATSADSGIEAGARLKAALTAVGGKGGGSPRLAQGSCPDDAALEAAWAALGIAG